MNKRQIVIIFGKYLKAEKQVVSCNRPQINGNITKNKIQADSIFVKLYEFSVSLK